MALEQIMALCGDNIAGLMKDSGLFDDVEDAKEMDRLIRSLIAGVDRLMKTHEETSELAGSFAVLAALVFADMFTRVALDSIPSDAKKIAELVQGTSTALIDASRKHSRRQLA